MALSSLTIQAYQNNQWQDIASLTFNDDKKISAFSYLSDYAFEHFLADNHFATSINYPVELFEYGVEHNWLPFLDDIIPAGASRRYWLQRLDLTRLTAAEQNYELLKNATIAPVGHLRIKEAVLDDKNLGKDVVPKKFHLTDIINRDVDFLEYASEHGAMAGGATGAGGEAPKLLLRWQDTDRFSNQSNSQGDSQPKSPTIWIDNQQLGDSADKYYLVKYPRGRRKDIDCDILRAEYHFYDELTTMGFNTIATDGMHLIEGDRYPSLWLPRFDIKVETLDDDTVKTTRLAMESVYSMLKKGAGSFLNHEQVIRELIEIIEYSQIANEGFIFDEQSFVIEWVRRDLLNIAFGNSDNHGRNTAFIRDGTSIWLAPIYDFAPMKADPEGIVRTMKWRSDRGLSSHERLESGGDYRFDLIAQSLADLIDPDKLMAELNSTALKLIGLKERLQARGVSDSILNYPSMNFKRLDEKLTQWRVL